MDESNYPPPLPELAQNAGGVKYNCMRTQYTDMCDAWNDSRYQVLFGNFSICPFGEDFY